MRKPCTACSEVKDITEFGRDKSRPDGYTHNCKECRNIASRDWTENNPIQAKKHKARWQADNIDKKRAADKVCKERECSNEQAN